MSKKNHTSIGKTLQASTSPADALELLRAGNDRFQSQNLKQRVFKQLLSNAASGQYPFAAILGCIDSRVPIEYVFDAAVGDLFVARVAGNTVNSDILGSLEYACKYAGSKLILVLGHTQCGAVQAAWNSREDDREDGHLTGLLRRIAPAVQAARAQQDDVDTETGLLRCVEINVDLACKQIRKESVILRELETTGAIAIVGAVYDVSTGAVQFNPQHL